MKNNHYLYKVYNNKYTKLISKNSDKKSIIADYNSEIVHYFYDFFESPNIETCREFLKYFGDEIKKKLQVEKLTYAEVLKFLLDEVICSSIRVFQNKISKEKLFTDFINNKFCYFCLDGSFVYNKSCFFIGKSFDGCFYFFETRDDVINCYKFETFREKNSNKLFKLLVTFDEELDSIDFKKSFNIDTHNFTLYESDFSRKLEVKS